MIKKFMKSACFLLAFLIVNKKGEKLWKVWDIKKFNVGFQYFKMGINS